jgi:hypothetical protein
MWLLQRSADRDALLRSGGGTARQRVIESFESRADVERFFQAAADA